MPTPFAELPLGATFSTPVPDMIGGGRLVQEVVLQKVSDGTAVAGTPTHDGSYRFDDEPDWFNPNELVDPIT